VFGGGGGILRKMKSFAFKFYKLRPYIFDDAKVLDVGCGNHSATHFKRTFPDIRYFGIDRDTSNMNQTDFDNMEKFYQIDLTDIDALAQIPDNGFDIIVMSHVIEHLKNGEEVIRALLKKLRQPAGGVLFIEFPSIRSLRLPHMKGTLNFYDDATHCRLYAIHELCNLLTDSGLKIIEAKPRKYWFQILLLPAYFIKTVIKKNDLAWVFWDLLGFADYIIAKKV
jgi:2-polyprenyl-3-methyl-5-hydroxy-6-metoxy-1,4-benzoquinol methylase